MLILTIRTDKPEAEVGLYNNENQLDYIIWQAHRQLAETLHTKILEILKKNTLTLKDVEGIVCFAGPGSFTGLRIGLTVANTLSYSLKCPIIAVQGEDWRVTGIKALDEGKNDKIALPEYGADAHITRPKH